MTAFLLSFTTMENEFGVHKTCRRHVLSVTPHGSVGRNDQYTHTIYSVPKARHYYLSRLSETHITRGGALYPTLRTLCGVTERKPLWGILVSRKQILSVKLI